MVLPDFAFVTPFILWQGEKRGGIGFNICQYLAVPVSLHLSYRKVKSGAGFNTCKYLAFPLSLHSSYGKVRRGAGLLCLCHSIHLIAR